MNMAARNVPGYKKKKNIFVAAAINLGDQAIKCYWHCRKIPTPLFKKLGLILATVWTENI